jgi:hypothetical protein
MRIRSTPRHNPEVAGGGRHSLTCGCERASSATRAACSGASRLVSASGPILTGWVVKSCDEPDRQHIALVQEALGGDPARPSYPWLVYDYDPEEVELLGWEGFVTCQWESIFVGYRSWVGRRSMVRRWSDLFEVGLGCPQEIAVWLATAETMDRADRDLEDAANAEALVSGMIGVVADLPDALAELGDLGPDLSGKILDQHTRLLSFVRAQASGQ